MRVLHITALISFLAALAAGQAVMASTIMLDFEEFTNGDIITESKGVQISVQERIRRNLVDGTAVVFDTAFRNRDRDLQRSVTRTPARRNDPNRPTGLSSTPIGGTPKLLIIQNTRQSPIAPDGSVTPNDNHEGGIITFDFAQGYGDDGVTLESVALAEVYRSRDSDDYLRLGYADGSSKTFFFHRYIGDNRSAVFNVADYFADPANPGSNSGVVTLELGTPNSGGIGNIAFTDFSFSGGGLDDSSAVPVPASAMLALAGLLMLARRRIAA